MAWQWNEHGLEPFDEEADMERKWNEQIDEGTKMKPKWNEQNF